MKRTITWLEGKKSDCASLIAAVRNEGYQVEVGNTVKTIVERAHIYPPDLVIAHLPSLRMGGKRIEALVRESVNSAPILFLSAPETSEMKVDETDDPIIYLPCTARKLVNRIHALLPDVITAGPLSLDMGENVVTCNGKEKSLTPRLTRLLSKLMRHSGEVIERRKLFGEVWHTNYTNDTRTLDVHISWLRQAIEIDPKKPKIIITVRGMGYRLDV